VWLRITLCSRAGRNPPVSRPGVVDDMPKVCGAAPPAG
jgi:hypothetical protein